MNGIVGTDVGTGAALQTLLRVDDIFAIRLRNNLQGALILATAALDASIGNYICHDKVPPLFLTFRLF